MKLAPILLIAIFSLPLFGCGGGGGASSSGNPSSPTPVPIPIASVSVFASNITAPKHLVFAGNNLYVTFQSGIKKLDTSGGVLQEYTVTNAVGIGVQTSGQSDHIYHTGNIISNEDTLFELGSVNPLLAYAHNNFDGIAFYSSNMLYAANTNNVLVYTNFVNPVTVSGLGGTPMAMAADVTNARVYLTLDNNTIGYLPTSGLTGNTQLTVLTQTSPNVWGPLNHPNGIAVSSNGFVYVVNQGDVSGNGGYISKINIGTGATETLISDVVGDWGGVPVGFCRPIGVAVDATNENLYVTNAGGCSSGYSGYSNRNKILKIKLP